VNKIQPQFPQLKVKLDWKNYYFKFSEQHGGNPVVYKEVQLFCDGWRYSLTDYAGPEYPPPEDKKELRKLQLVYWYTRWNRAKNELNFVEQKAVMLRNLQSTKDGQLQHIVTSEDENGKKLRESVDYNPHLFDHVIRFLKNEVEDANKHLAALKENT